MFSLLGPNGAGKTTTVNVLTTLLKADAGTARAAGYDVLASVLTNLFAIAALIGVAFLLGLDPAATLTDWLGALVWCAVIAVVGYVWARSTFTKRA